MIRINFKIFIVIFLTLLLTSCKVEEVISLEETYVEYTVVQAELHPDEKFPGVRFTKTLPLGVPFNIQEAELKDITVYIKLNGIQVIPLHYSSEGLYKPLYDFYIHPGETYELFAEKGDKYIYAYTKIPNYPEVSATHYNTNSFYTSADVSTEPDIVYSALWAINTGQLIKADDFYVVTEPRSTPNQVINIRTSSIPEIYRESQYDYLRAIQIFAFDKSFREYFDSRTSAQEINNPFIQGGGSVVWNVKGDKTIGMFIGVTAGNVLTIN